MKDDALSQFNADFVFCRDLQKPVSPISTGIGFLDHMIDQFNSHAQIGVALTISDPGVDGSSPKDHNLHASHDQAKLMRVVGSTLGTEFRKLLQSSPTTGSSSRFCCPLDEALVACELEFNDKAASDSNQSPGKLKKFTLPPYGKFPSTGRKHVGQMETDKLELFWKSLAEHSGLQVNLDKIRGDNGHHIVESSFKAFSRALRNLLDGTNTVIGSDNRLDQVYGPASENFKTSVDMNRNGTVERATKETSISATVSFDGRAVRQIDTGIVTLDTFLSTLALNAGMSLVVSCKGDLWIDEHHTAEDVSIAIGQVLAQAFGTKAGLNRMWSSAAKVGDSEVEVTMDLSNRPCFTHNLPLDNGEDEKVGDLSLEMFEHVLDSLVVNARMTVHIVSSSPSSPSGALNLEDTVQAVGIAFGQALKYCSMVDCRRAGATASSKGTLSV